MYRPWAAHVDRDKALGGHGVTVGHGPTSLGRGLGSVLATLGATHRRSGCQPAAKVRVTQTADWVPCSRLEASQGRRIPLGEGGAARRTPLPEGRSGHTGKGVCPPAAPPTHTPKQECRILPGLRKELGGELLPGCTGDPNHRAKKLLDWALVLPGGEDRTRPVGGDRRALGSSPSQ